MFAYSPLSAERPETRLIGLAPGGDNDDIVCSLSSAPLELSSDYEVISYLQTVNVPTTTISLNEISLPVDNVAKNILLHLRQRDSSRRLWMDRICINQGDAKELAGQTPLMKLIHKCAKRVLIWIGEHHEEDDPMNAYLGQGTLSSTQHAFDFAKSLASASPSDIGSVSQMEFPQTGLPSWCYLARLVYRPWFRGLPLLRTSYLEGLSDTVVLCGAASVPWAVLSKATERIRMTKPIPRFLHDISPEPHGIWPGMELEDGVRWLKARQRFGFEPAYMLAKNFWSLQDDVDPEQKERLIIFLGLSTDIFDSDYLHGELSRHLESFKAAGTHNVTGETGILEPAEPVPSLPFEGCLSPAPIPEDQAAFVHTPLMRPKDMRLLLLVPHYADPSSPIQCGLIHVSREQPPAFAYVLNATLKDPRLTTLILVNGQSFRVPKALEIFLRHVRHESEECLLFILKICEDPKFASAQSRGPIQGYTILKEDLYLPQASATIDMYSVLDRARDTQSEQLPKGMSWDDWLLELND
ncbi:MAG: hypothetical protein M1839_004488 [Geoglossum umbratile]|nr:MAG: hypothetical protein M1839_004488 [Geoglossum umbratile]